MSSTERQTWRQRIRLLDVALSLTAALIEIGLFLSYVGAVVTIEAATVSGLSVAIAFILQYYWRNRRLLESYKAQQALSKDYPAIVAFLNALRSLPKEFRIDKQILYDEIEHTYEIEGADASYTRRTLGHNVSDENLERAVYRICGETSIENGKLRPKVFRNLAGGEKEKLEPSVLWSTSNVKLVGVDLNPPVAPGVGKIDLTFSAKWRGAFVSKYGYVFVSLNHCLKEVKKLKVHIIFKEKVTKCSVWTFDLAKHTLEELEKLKNPKLKRNKHTITWERAHPEIHKIYIFRYRRSCIK